MEKKNNNNLRNELTDHSLKSKSSAKEMMMMSNYYFNNPNYVEDYGRFSWPPRSYICTFCKREFKSAQALGGHMNVHRRDRARFRCQSPPSSDINLNTIPNPNPSLNPSPNPNPSTTTTCILPSIYPSHHKVMKFYVTEDALRTNLSQVSAGSDSGRAKAVKSLFGVKEFVGLHLGIGLDSDHHFMKEDHVDLELRLGYS